MHKNPGMDTDGHPQSFSLCVSTCTNCVHRGSEVQKALTRAQHNNPLKSPPVALSFDQYPPHSATATHRQSASISLSLSPGKMIALEVTLSKFKTLRVADSKIMHSCLLVKVTRYIHFHIHASYFQLKRSSSQQLFAQQRGAQGGEPWMSHRNHARDASDVLNFHCLQMQAATFVTYLISKLSKQMVP